MNAFEDENQQSMRTHELELEVARLNAELEALRGEGEPAEVAARFLTMAAATVDQAMADARREADELAAEVSAAAEARRDEATRIAEEAEARTEALRAEAESHEALVEAANHEADEIKSAAEDLVAAERVRVADEVERLSNVRAALETERGALESYHEELKRRVQELAESMVSFMTTEPPLAAVTALDELGSGAVATAAVDPADEDTADEVIAEVEAPIAADLLDIVEAASETTSDLEFDDADLEFDGAELDDEAELDEPIADESEDVIAEVEAVHAEVEEPAAVGVDADDELELADPITAEATEVAEPDEVVADVGEVDQPVAVFPEFDAAVFEAAAADAEEPVVDDAEADIAEPAFEAPSFEAPPAFPASPFAEASAVDAEPVADSDAFIGSAATSGTSLFGRAPEQVHNPFTEQAVPAMPEAAAPPAPSVPVDAGSFYDPQPAAPTFTDMMAADAPAEAPMPPAPPAPPTPADVGMFGGVPVVEATPEPAAEEPSSELPSRRKLGGLFSRNRNADSPAPVAEDTSDLLAPEPPAQTGGLFGAHASRLIEQTSSEDLAAALADDAAEDDRFRTFLDGDDDADPSRDWLLRPEQG